MSISNRIGNKQGSPIINYRSVQLKAVGPIFIFVLPKRQQENKHKKNEYALEKESAVCLNGRQFSWTTIAKTKNLS